jgi:pilus assembly protein CpaE
MIDARFSPVPAEAKAGPVSSRAPPQAVAFVLDRDSEGVVRRSFVDFGMIDGEVAQGNIDTATKELAERGWPRLLLVDVSGVDDPLMRINRLAEMCDPRTEVVVVGERNDIVLYRDLKAAGVAEYFFKPLSSALLNRVLEGLLAGAATTPAARSGKLVIVLGVRGGVGATTIAANAAWYIAEKRERRVLLVDLDLQAGDAALQLDVQPSHAMREALDHPDRIDDLFLERGIANVTPRLGLLAALEPLAERLIPDEEAVLQLIGRLLSRYRYVFVDLPDEVALLLPRILHLPGTLLLVSNGSLSSARDVVRWREKIGANTSERSLLHVLNKSGCEGALPASEFMRIVGQAPDIAIPFGREVEASSKLGIRATQRCAPFRRSIADLSSRFVGRETESAGHWWKRAFG